jgi:hypothetical protein
MLPILEYTRLMNKTNMASTPTPFALEFDFSTEGYENVWEAMGATLTASIQSEDAIVSATYKGTMNGWPILYIVFASLECAKAFTYVYLGFDTSTRDADVYSDDEVNDYVAAGRFV